MKNKIKGLLALALAAFTSLTWAAELVIPYSFDGKIGNTEYAYEYKVVMPNTALTSFTTTIRYAGGSHRVEILSVKLLDGETTYTAEATGTDGDEVVEEGASYSGNNSYNNVYTFTNEDGFTASKVYTLQVNLKVTNNPPSHNGNIKVSGGITLDVAPFSFGVNFKKGDAQQDISTTTGAGFAKGSYAAPVNWANYTADGGNHATYTVNSTAIDVSWVARDGYYSSCSTDTDAGKLLYGYLDDVANNGRTKATVTISGLPENKKYAVALVLSGDGNGDANFNNRFSPVWINNEVYAYNSETTLVKGDEAKAIQYWGSRAASAAAAGLVEGTNVMFVEGLSGGAISITSAMDDSNVSRLTIASVQVWVTDEAAEAPAAPEDKETISLNFYSSQGSVSGEAGLVAAGGWNNLGNNGSESALNVWTGEKAVSYPMTLTYSSNNGYQWTTATDAFLKGYLDDGGNQAQVSLTGIPFEEYSVIVYAATDTASRKFRSVTINGQAYIGTPGATTLGFALPVYNNTHARYGASHALTAAYGTNALRVDGLSGDLTIAGGANQYSARGGIAAIQIINTGAALPDDQVIDWTSQPAEQLKTSALPELTNVSVQLKLAEGATLEMDSDITGHTIEIVGNNVTVNVTNLEISQAAAQVIFPGATVTTAYTETFGIEVDGINHPYFFRGTENATYNDAANWYIGKRVMGEQTKWLSVSGDKAPGMPNSAMWQHILLDGEMMDTITRGEDGYKTITSTSNLEGWNPRYTVINGAHLVISGLVKIQNGDGANAEWRVDETSKITFNGSLSTGHRVDFYVKSENGVTASNLTLTGSTNYELDSAGSVVVGALNGTATINGVELNLGDSALSGRKVVSRKLVGFTSSNAAFSVAEGAVTTSVEAIAATEAVSLRNVGDYKFEQKEDGYYVNFVAYAAADEIGEVSTWTAKEDTAWATEGNWTFGVPTAGADAVISIAADTTITIPAEGVTVDVLTVNGEGTLTIAGGKITAGTILANTSIAADETTLALAPMNIAEGKTMTYAINTNGEQKVPALLGSGTFVKAGSGMLTMDKDSVCDASITVNAGTLRFHEYAYDKTYNIVAKDGAKIQVGTWAGSLTSISNNLKLEGGAMLQLNNGNAATGAIIKGTIVIDSTAEKPAVIKGNNNGNNGVIAATIKGNGVLEIQDNNDNYFTISGVISDGDAEGDVLAVKIVTDRGVIFTGANTYTGGTVIAEGATVSVSNINTIFGTGNVTGAGTVKIAGGTYNGLSLAQYTDANTTIEIPADSTVTGYFNEATWTCAAKIRLDGTLNLTNGFGAGRYTFTGPWTGAGGISLSHASPADAIRITGDISGFTGNLSVAGARAITFCAATTGNNQKYAGKICVHGDYAYTAKVNGTWSAPVVVENGAKIGGEGSIDNTLTFNAGSIIDGSVAATGDVTLNGTVTVSGEAGATVLTCANAESLDLTKFAAPAGLKCVAENGAVKLAVANVSFVPATAESMSVEVAAATEDAAMAMVDIQRPEGVGDDVVTAEDYAAYFTKTATGENGTFTVTVSLKDDVKPVVGTTDDADDAFTVDADGVTIAINNYKPGLYYGIRSATELGALKTVEAVNVDVKEDKINVAKLTGDSAFYQVVVDVKPFPSVNDGAEGDAPESGPDAE